TNEPMASIAKLAAQDIANFKGIPIRFVRFRFEEELEIIKPQPPFDGPRTRYREKLEMIPDHMKAPILVWFEKGEPHPNSMGSFLRAILSNDMSEAVAHADDGNAKALRNWVLYLRNFAPAGSFGSAEALLAWH